MATNEFNHKFLTHKDNNWHYQRRVPERYRHIDSRGRIRISLKTGNRELAGLRRDAMAAADEALWVSLDLEAAENDGVSEATYKAEQQRYKAAQKRAIAFGFSYRKAEDLKQDVVSQNQVAELLARIEFLEGRSGKAGLAERADAEAVLGAVAEPKQPSVSVSKAFAIYLEKIAFSETAKKSEKQRYSWKKTKQTSVSYFTEVIGDVDMEAITRDMANSYRSWWIERMIPGDELLKPAKPNTANRHIGNMRKLYDDYFTYVGEEDRLNPFRKMFFKDDQDTKVPSFENDWVREKVLVPGVFDGLNDDLRLMIYVLIETGARISEICNLLPENIHLDADVPHIAIAPVDREIKTPTSKRELPLVGSALDAMREAPRGFHRYRDKGELVSANLLKAFRQRDLFPTTDHVIYSFRHAFEDRMLEAGIDHDMRYYLMGHKNTRPAYGKRGTLEFRRDQLLKIVHPYPKGLITPAEQSTIS